MKASANFVQSVLQAHNLDCEVREFPASARSATEAAAAIGCAVEDIAKSLVFRSGQSNSPVLVITAGNNRVDETRVAVALGEPLEKASAEFVREATGFAIGGVPPVGHRTAPITFIDRDLLEREQVWAAAGTPNAVFRISPDQLVDLTGGQVIEVKQVKG